MGQQLITRYMRTFSAEIDRYPISVVFVNHLKLRTDEEGNDQVPRQAPLGSVEGVDGVDDGDMTQALSAMSLTPQQQAWTEQANAWYAAWHAQAAATTHAEPEAPTANPWRPAS